MAETYLEKEWLAGIEYFSQKELLEIIPESKPTLEDNLRVMIEEQDSLKQRCKSELERTKKLKGFDLWFLEKMIEVWYVFPIEELERQITRLNWTLNPGRAKTDGSVTDEMIQRAREHSIVDILGVQNDKQLVSCPFHEEKAPSMNIKKNYYYCHGCGATGDVISLAMKLNGWGFLETVRNLQ